ncbi:MAG: RNA-protein complex protein Nop10 [Candidatus Helarchaeota archaeon]
MGKLLRKCSFCKRYTISKLECPKCGGKTINPHPAKFSIQDKYGKYRRAAKKMSENRHTVI